MEERWKDITGYEGLYQVSNLGRVKSLPRKIPGRNQFGASFMVTTKEKIMHPSQVGRGWKEGAGYLSVNLTSLAKKNRRKNVHRLVAEAFIPNPDGKPEVNHKDGDKQNNHIDNLEWVTKKENMQHCMYTIKTLRNIYQPVKTLCVETGEVYPSTSEAARRKGLSRRALSSAIEKRSNYGGFHWEKV